MNRSHFSFLWEYRSAGPASPTAQTVKPGQSATYHLTVGTATGFTGNVPISCISGTDLNPVEVPPGVQCTVNVDSVDLTSSVTSAPVTVTISTTAQSARQSFPFHTLPLSFGAVFAWNSLERPIAKRALLFCADCICIGPRLELMRRRKLEHSASASSAEGSDFHRLGILSGIEPRGKQALTALR